MSQIILDTASLKTSYEILKNMTKSSDKIVKSGKYAMYYDVYLDGIIFRLLRRGLLFKRMGGYTEEERRVCRFQSHLGRVQSWLR